MTSRAILLDLLRVHQGLSRADIARRAGLSEAAVSRTAAQLLREGLITEQGAENSTGGRPGTRLQINPANLLAVAADIRGFSTLR